MMKIENLKNNWEYRTIVKFLRKEKLYHIFQKLKSDNDGRDLILIISAGIKFPSDFSDFVFNITRGCLYPNSERLVYSQLWRFFSLEELENVENNTLKHNIDIDDLRKRLIRSIESNGYRNSKRVIDLFKKHKLEF